MAQNQDFKFSNKTTNLLAQCKIVIYPWSADLSDPDISDSALSEATRLDISSQIQSCTVQKNMGSAAGSFSFTLTNSPGIGTDDWKDIIKQGYWCVIYMTQDGDLALNPVVGKNIAKSKSAEAKKIRCIGYVERVGVRGSIEENRSIDMGFVVSGRDIGIVYEETNIWHNLFKYDKIMLDSIAQTKMNIAQNVTVDAALDTIHDLFYYPADIDGAKVNDNNSLLSIGLQWLLPKPMVSDVGFSLTNLANGPYWGALDVTNFLPTVCGIAIDKPGDYLSGNAWEQLKRLSVPQYHELFCESDDNGKPRLTFRPIPWGIDQTGYPNTAKYIQLYKDIKEIELVTAVDLYSFEVAEDDHSRYNSFLATVSTTLISVENNIALLDGSDYPFNNSASVRRHGFRPMHVTVDSIVKNEQLGNGAANRDQLIEFNEILYDYWNNAIFAESGVIDKAGSSGVKIGKCMKFDSDVPYLCTKRYYIEGYSDSFTVDENRVPDWTQSVSLTRGFEEADLVNRSGFGYRNTSFTAPGEFTKGSSGSGK